MKKSVALRFGKFEVRLIPRSKGEDYNLYLDGILVPGIFSYSKGGFLFKDYKIIGEEEILRYLKTGNFMRPNINRFQVYSFEDIAEVILEKKEFVRFSGEIRNIFQLEEYIKSPYYHLYINGELVPGDFCNRQYLTQVISGVPNQISKLNIKNYLRTGSLWGTKSE